MWIIWASFLVGAVIIKVVLGDTGPGSSEDILPLPLAYAPPILLFLVSSLLRWLVLSKQKEVMPALTVMIIGLALAEAILFIGLFLVPSQQVTLLIFALLAMIQYIPLWASSLPPTFPSHG